MAFKHEGFLQCMNTIRDKHNLEKMWDSIKRRGNIYNFESQKE
ncbi:MAG: hypothetical protein NT145_08795 [Elusimicrobia bacterium]|nr:hypothetical protein [Elusimicrobiota bacterium]